MEQNSTDPAEPGRTDSHGTVYWILLGILALIVLASFFLDNPLQSWVITGGLLLGLAGIIATAVRAKQRSDG